MTSQYNNTGGNAIEHFSIRGEDGYSAYWRRDKSPTEILELAKSLVAIRKIVSYVGQNVGDIVWSGMGSAAGISLDPALVTGKYPVPAAKTDIIIGIAIHKAYLKTEWSERVKQTVLAQLNILEHNAYIFDLFFDMCEKVYTDILSKKSPLGLYTEKARQWEIRERYKGFADVPTVAELLYTWWTIAAHRTGEHDSLEGTDRLAGIPVKREILDKYYKNPLTLLHSIVGELREECPHIAGVVERCRFRATLYGSIWPRLYDYLKSWPTGLASATVSFNERWEKNQEYKPEGERGRIINLPDNIEKRATDFTDKIKDNVVNKGRVVTIVSDDIVIPLRARADKDLLVKLQWIVKAVSRRKISISRGLRTGVIDRRRLFRAVTTGNIFEAKKNYFELENEIVILLDASYSMAFKWDIVKSTVLALFEAFIIYNNKVRVFAYNGKGSVCKITELAINNKLYGITPQGKTASGEAIMATAMSLKKSMKKPFIIHITDGASNWGCGVHDAIQYCQNNKITILALGYGCNSGEKKTLIEEYGRLVRFIENNKQLPNMLRELLNHSKWGGKIIPQVKRPL